MDRLSLPARTNAEGENSRDEGESEVTRSEFKGEPAELPARYGPVRRVVW